MSIQGITSTYPFIVFTNSKHSNYWVVNQRTGEKVSQKGGLSKKEAYDLAREKHLKMNKEEN